MVIGPKTNQNVANNRTFFFYWSEDESLDGYVDLESSSQARTIRARYSSKFRSTSNRQKQKYRPPNKKEKMSSELKTSKVTKYIYSFRNI